MKKILFLIMIVLNMNLFSFSLNSLDFNETLKKGEIKTKEYILKNNTTEIKRYKITTDNKAVNVKPSTLILQPQTEKKILLKVRGIGVKGENQYRLIISEKNLNKDKKTLNNIYLNKVVRIKQKYYLD